ncbi:MAG: TetR/AcrR family transcriptional regulator [Actinomycetota bacterium]|nr:TetR/AcrR family transcriptional regulator [Actinomycetota bacterium]
MALLDVQRAAVDLFSRRGFEATGIRELGAAVGLNSATLYHYAGGKQEVLAEIMRLCLDELLACGRAALASSTDPMEQLAALIASHVGISALNPRTALVTDQEMRALAAERRTALMGVRDDYEALFAAVLTRGAKRRMFRLVDAGLTRLALLEMCNGVAHWYRPGGRLSVEDVQRRFVELGARLVGVDDSEPWTGPLAEARMLDIEPRVSVSA